MRKQDIGASHALHALRRIRRDVRDMKLRGEEILAAAEARFRGLEATAGAAGLSSVRAFRMERLRSAHDRLLRTIMNSLNDEMLALGSTPAVRPVQRPGRSWPASADRTTAAQDFSATARAHMETVDNASAFAAGMLDNASAILHRTRPRLLVPIPVAGAESPATVRQALDEFAKQVQGSAPPFWIGLSINAPPDEHGAIMELTGVVSDFQTQHPDLPLTYFATTYDPETFAIGRVRRDLCAAFCGAVLEKYGPTGAVDTSLVFNDIDLMRLSPDYLSKLDTALRSGANIAQASLRHMSSGGRFPNMDRVMFWRNFPSTLDPLGLQANANATRLPAYLATDGFQATDTIREDMAMLSRLLALPGDALPITRPAGAFARVSARREQEYMRRGISPRDVWLDNQFGMHDSYRTAAAGTDIDSALADEFIAQLTARTGTYGSGRTPLDAIAWFRMCHALGIRDRIAPEGWSPTPAQAKQLKAANQQISRALRIAEMSLASR